MFKNRLNVLLGVAMVLAILIAGTVLYFEELKPRLTAAEQQVQKYFTFQITCDIQVPIKAIFQSWEKDAFVYLIPCVMPPGTEVVQVSNGVPNLYPVPKPGLHFITVADSAPVSVFDWTHYWTEVQGLDLDVRENAERSQALKFFDFYGMQVFELYPKSDVNVKTLSFICHEELDTARMMVEYKCNSD